MIEQVLWDAYCSTHLKYTDEHHNDFHVVPTVSKSDTWPWGDEVPEIFIISAANPYSEKLSDEANLKYERRLKADLTKAGFKYHLCQGQSTDGRWVERSLMVINAPLPVIKQLGDEYLQNAIFRWTPHSWECISLVSDQHFVTGWTML